MRTAALVFLLAATALGQGVTPPPPPPPPVTESPMMAFRQDVAIVSGTGDIDMRPDSVSFNAGVETEGKDIRKIVASNNAKIEAVIAALKQRGVTAAEIKTSELSLSAVEKDDVKVGFRIVNHVGVTRKTANDAGELIAAAIEAGANDVDGPQFSVANEKAVQDRCIELAFADARAKAQKLATLAQRRLGAVLAVTDGSSSPFEMIYRSPGVEGGAIGGMLSVEPGVHTVHCGVTAAFRLE